jgi:hypothetical protein
MNVEDIKDLDFPGAVQVIQDYYTCSGRGEDIDLDEVSSWEELLEVCPSDYSFLYDLILENIGKPIPFRKDFAPLPINPQHN